MKLWELIERILYFVIYKLFRLKLSGDKWKVLLQFVKFGIVGVSNTIISYLLYLGFLKLFQQAGILPRVDYLVAEFIGFTLSVFWSFYWNWKKVFEREEGVKWYFALLKTYISYSFTGVFLNSILLIFWVRVCHMPKELAPIINLLISVPLNFLLNKFWAFKGKQKREDS